MKKFSAVLVVILGLSVFAGCGSEADQGGRVQEPIEEAAETVSEAVEDGGEEMVETADSIQATLTYFGSLKANDSDDKFAVFRSADGDLIYFFMLNGYLDYGIPTGDTAPATTADGQEYTTVTLGDTYGYSFTNPDATEGFIVDKDGNVLPATELGEEGARELVDMTF